MNGRASSIGSQHDFCICLEHTRVGTEPWLPRYIGSLCPDLIRSRRGGTHCGRDTQHCRPKIISSKVVDRPALIGLVPVLQELFNTLERVVDFREAWLVECSEQQVDARRVQTIENTNIEKILRRNRQLDRSSM